MSNPPLGYARVSPYLLYEDAAAAVEYLQRAFGFELRLSEVGGAGRTHNELLVAGDGLIMLGQAGEGFSSPRTLATFPPSMVHVYVDDVDGLHARATTAGAEVTELEISPAGDRRFTATDPEGHVWVFAQRLTLEPRKEDTLANPVRAGSDASAGTYKCTACGNTIDVGSTTHLQPCANCGNGNWETITGGDSVKDPTPNR
jgi:uncharacterized glyoxalase superfamily protein PhnB